MGRAEQELATRSSSPKHHALLMGAWLCPTKVPASPDACSLLFNLPSHQRHRHQPTLECRLLFLFHQRVIVPGRAARHTSGGWSSRKGSMREGAARVAKAWPRSPFLPRDGGRCDGGAPQEGDPRHGKRKSKSPAWLFWVSLAPLSLPLFRSPSLSLSLCGLLWEVGQLLFLSGPLGLAGLLQMLVLMRCTAIQLGCEAPWPGWNVPGSVRMCFLHQRGLVFGQRGLSVWQREGFLFGRERAFLWAERGLSFGQRGL